MSLKIIANVTDLTALGVVVGSYTAVLPAISAGVAIIWGGIRIYEWARVVVWGKSPR